ncbi:DUF1176 domain-containing protein [Chania multitudinisentens]|nr:DUF1176 domain-containing protein [Chania multitudinisentens]
MIGQGFWKHYVGKFFASLVLLAPLVTWAASETESRSFSHKDWDLVCDNTLTCRAAGYSPTDTELGVTVLLTREAGAATPIINQVILAEIGEVFSDKPRGIPELVIDKRSLGKLKVDNEQDEIWRMDAAQLTAFLSALRRDSQISFKDNLGDYVFSGAGSSAVLLKMDDVQGRVGTLGALFKKGPNDESAVRKPVAKPVIIKVPVKDKESREMTPQEMAFLKPLLMKEISIDEDGGCSDELVNAPDVVWQLARLNENQSLVIIECWRAAYNYGAMYWVTDNDMKQPPELITDSGTDYRDGTIDFLMKGRGLGDCLDYESWVWNGKTFVSNEAGNSGRCRMIRGGGAWNMLSLTSTVVAP